MPTGSCVLCGTHCNLTFEHVPPKYAFNRNTRYQTVPYLEILQSNNPLDLKFTSRIEQGGIGFYSLCSTCNSFLGNQYVTAYTSYSNSFIELAKRIPSNHFVIEMRDFETLKVLKQIVSMFLCINSWEFSSNHPELAKFVLNPNQTQLSSRFRFFVYLNTEGQLRNIPITITGSSTTNISIAASEITFPPLGHVMTVDFSGKLPFHQEITAFTKTTLDNKIDYRFEMYRLPTILPLILDYRTKEDIATTINDNQNK